MSRSTESLSQGIDVSIKNVLLFVPALVPIGIHLFFTFLAYVIFSHQVLEYNWWDRRYYEAMVPDSYVLWGGAFLAFIFGFVAQCVIVDMASDALQKKTLNLSKSFNVVTSRLGVLIVAALIAAVCAITFVLIPIAFFIITIAVLENVDAAESTKKAFDFVIKNLGEVIVFLILVIVIDIIFTFAFTMIPVVGPYLGVIIQWLLNVVFTVSAVSFYIALRHTTNAPPPPPPPPPPPQIL